MIGFPLECITRIADVHAATCWRPRDRSRPLLGDVDQLVGQHAATGCGPRRVPAVLEHDVLADGVGVGAKGACRLGRLRPGVDPDGGEVLAQPGLHDGPQRGVERAPFAGGKRLVDVPAVATAGKEGRHAGVAGGPLQVQHRQLMGRVPAPACRCRSGATGRLRCTSLAAVHG